MERPKDFRPTNNPLPTDDPARVKNPKSRETLPVILVADDERDVLELVGSNLKDAGFSVLTAEDGQTAIDTARKQLPAAIILDLMLPGMSGFDVCKAVKANPATAAIPILMLTAKAEQIDRILGFELGADDYVTKPFSPRELVLRVRSVLRRTPAAEAGDLPDLKAGELVISRSSHAVRLRGKPVDLTALEFKLLRTLFERRGRLQSRERLLNDVWGYETSIDTRTVDSHVRRLRAKLGKAADYIETVRGFGYRIREEA